MDYQLMDKTTQLNLVKARIKDLENQHFNLSLRVEAPDLTQPPSEMDQANLTRLETSISHLRELEKSLSAPPATTAPNSS